jgi:hypothetical protein
VSAAHHVHRSHLASPGNEIVRSLDYSTRKTLRPAVRDLDSYWGPDENFVLVNEN